MSATTEQADVVIVGTGQAGAQTAIALRSQNFAGSIVMLGEEDELPYERPPLSKEYLAGDKPFEKMLLRPAPFWTQRNIDIRTGHRVVEVDAAAHVVRTETGKALGYQRLVWATGGKPRQLPCGGHDLRGVHAVRDRADVDRMRRELESATRAVMVGGGYIGLEVAAVLRKMGKEVTVLEAENRLLARVAGETISRFYEAEHRAQGVHIRLGSEVIGLEGKDGRVTAVARKGGERIPADIVVVGIGIVPAVAPLLAAGAEGDSGVLTDLRGKTTLADIYAVGDCALHPNVHAGGKCIRLESVQNAIDLSNVVAKALAGTLGPDERYDALPWFWSNQYDLLLQSVGLATNPDDVVVRGDPNAKSFSVAYLRDKKIVALDCVNRTKDYVQGRGFIPKGCIVDRAKLAADVPIKELA